MESQPERALIPSTATIARVTPIPSRKGASAREGIDTHLTHLPILLDICERRNEAPAREGITEH